jgi:hypothetical protein
MGSVESLGDMVASVLVGGAVGCSPAVLDVVSGIPFGIILYDIANTISCMLFGGALFH